MPARPVIANPTGIEPASAVLLRCFGVAETMLLSVPAVLPQPSGKAAWSIVAASVRRVGRGVHKFGTRPRKIDHEVRGIAH